MSKFGFDLVASVAAQGKQRFAFFGRKIHIGTLGNRCSQSGYLAACLSMPSRARSIARAGLAHHSPDSKDEPHSGQSTITHQSGKFVFLSCTTCMR